MAPPLAGQKRERHLWWKPFTAMDLPQQVDSGEKRVLSAERTEDESIEDKPRHRPQGSLPVGQFLKRRFSELTGETVCNQEYASGLE
jgi:hypothetical protein